MDEKPQKEKPSPELVRTLMGMYPKLDFLMAETLLSFTEAELGVIMEEEKSPDKNIDDDEISEVE